MFELRNDLVEKKKKTVIWDVLEKRLRSGIAFLSYYCIVPHVEGEKYLHSRMEKFQARLGGKIYSFLVFNG